MMPHVHLIGLDHEGIGVENAGKWLKNVARAVGDALVYLECVWILEAS